MTKEDAKDFLFDMSYLIGTTAVEHWTEKDAEKMRHAVLTIENKSAQPEQKIGKIVRWMEKRETPDYISYTPHCKCSLCGNELLINSVNYCYVCGARLIEDREAERRAE